MKSDKLPSFSALINLGYTHVVLRPGKEYDIYAKSLADAEMKADALSAKSKPCQIAELKGVQYM
jgi:hypothetical protein